MTRFQPVKARDPGPRAISSRYLFKRDEEFTIRAINFLFVRKLFILEGEIEMHGRLARWLLNRSERRWRAAIKIFY